MLRLGVEGLGRGIPAGAVRLELFALGLSVYSIVLRVWVQGSKDGV